MRGKVKGQRSEVKGIFRLSRFTAILALCLALTGAVSHAADTVQPGLGASLADVKLYDLDGRLHEMTEVKSRAVVVVFWAFWCCTWREALPELLALQDEAKELNCEIWTVSVDGRRTEEVRPLVSNGTIPFPVLLDDESLSERLGIVHVPTVLVLDRSRTVIWSREAYPGNKPIEDAVRSVPPGATQ